MALKKSELYSSLWKSCDELRGGMDASQYKDYVLILLFVKYVSDKYAGDPDALIDVPAGGGFADMVAAKGSKEIGDRINKIIGRLADANDSLKGAINVADFNDEEKLGKADAMVQRLTRLVAIFEGLNFGGNRAEGDDILGDAYEYLMRHFATESGKSKGQFYTPAEVSRIMAKIIGIRDASTSNATTVYDPTCGSGSLLLKVGDAASARVTLYGQAALDRLAAELESAAAELAELEEEEGGEEGIFAELEKVNRANVSARLREARAIYHTNDEAGAEADVLDKWLALSNREAELKKQLWDAEADLDAKAYARYPKLTGAEIKTLVVDDKWLAALAAAIHGEMDRISQALTQRVRELAERYETPLPQATSRVIELEARVNAHLAKMGFALS